MKLPLFILVSMSLVACSEPISDMPRFAAEDVAEGAPLLEIAPKSSKNGPPLAALSGPVPFGKVVKNCSVRGKQLGKPVEKHPAKSPKYKLYDSNPGATGLRTFYVTGFADGCARQFTAALAVFGSVTLHEQIRYGLPAEIHPYSDTDKAYDKLKSKACGVPKRKPCGRKISRLERGTVFLSIYERFGGNARWNNVLLHNGRIAAQDRKGV